jgi:hypothetical protein
MHLSDEASEIMKHALQSVVGGCLLLSGASAADIPDPNWHEERSDSGLLIAQSHDDPLAVSLLGVVEQIQEQLKNSFGLEPDPNTRLVVRVENWSYQTTDAPPSLVGWTTGSILNLQITVQCRPTEGPEALLRRVVEATLYQSIYQGGANTATGNYLVTLPVWLVEGLLQGILEGHPELDAQIVSRAKLLQKTPPLATIMGWKQLSADRVERAWQQAFCYQVLLWVLADRERWPDCRKWLADQAHNPNTQATPWPLDAITEVDWQSFQARPPVDADTITFSWDRTATELAAKQSLLLPASEKHPAVLVPFDKLAEFREHPGFGVAVTNKLSELMVLEMRANFAWRPIIQQYRLGLSNLLKPATSQLPPGAKKGSQIGGSSTTEQSVREEYLQTLADCAKMVRGLNDYRKRVEDYLNWYEVTKRTPMQDSSFESYFRLNDQLEGADNKMNAEQEADMVKIERKM